LELILVNMNTDKKYWLFGGQQYYPRGGMDDFQGSFYSASDARDEIRESDNPCVYFDWYHIFNSKSGEIVEVGYGGDLVN